MIRALAATFPERLFQVVADAAYANASIIKKLPSNVDFIGRARLDAALYAPPRAQRMGRPRVKGQRLSSPPAASAQAGFKPLEKACTFGHGAIEAQAGPIRAGTCRPASDHTISISKSSSRRLASPDTVPGVGMKLATMISCAAGGPTRSKSAMERSAGACRAK